MNRVSSATIVLARLSTMAVRAGKEKLASAGLLALCFVPAAAGIARLFELASGARITPDNARFFAAPIPIGLHIVSAVFFCVAGAFQFSGRFRARNPGWHRASGRMLVPAGLMAAISGMVLTLSYPPVQFDGPALFGLRLAVGSAMAFFLLAGTNAVLRREFHRHRAWMVRAYALGMGAGTQVITHLPWILFPGIRSEATRALLMGAGWAINLAVAEWIVRKKPAPTGGYIHPEKLRDKPCMGKTMSS